MAPNLVTLLGLSANILSVLIFIFFDLSLRMEFSSAYYIFCGFCVFFYSTMDAMDGKHARRTGESTPLG
jgi:phosphatidylglycerophosphate synthase